MEVGTKRSRDEGGLATEEENQKRPKYDTQSNGNGKGGITTPDDTKRPEKKKFLLQKFKQLAGRVENMLATQPALNNHVAESNDVTFNDAEIKTTPEVKNVMTPNGQRGRSVRKPVQTPVRGPGRPPTTPKTPQPITTVTEGRPKRQGKAKVAEDYDDTAEKARGRKPEPWYTQCSKALHTLMMNKWAWPFVDPVNPEELQCPDYFDIIKNPMDLGTIRKNLDAKKYTSPEEFANDVRLTWNNCYLYNKPDSDIVKMAHQLSAIFEKRFPKILDSCSAEKRAQREQDRKVKAEQQKEEKKQAGRPSKKPMYKDEVEDDRPMTYDEKRTLSFHMKKLPPEKLGGVVEIIRARQVQTTNQSNDEIEIDLDQLDNITLRQLSRFVRSALTQKKRRPAKKAATPQTQEITPPTDNHTVNNGDAAMEDVPKQEETKQDADNASTATTQQQTVFEDVPQQNEEQQMEEEGSFVQPPNNQQLPEEQTQPQLENVAAQQQHDDSDSSTSESDSETDSDSDSQSDTDKITFDPSGPRPLTSAQQPVKVRCDKLVQKCHCKYNSQAHRQQTANTNYHKHNNNNNNVQFTTLTYLHTNKVQSFYIIIATVWTKQSQLSLTWGGQEANGRKREAYGGWSLMKQWKP